MYYTWEGLEKLSNLLAQARGNKSQRQFARELGISHRTVVRLEKAEIPHPRNDTLEIVAPAVGYDLDSLIALLKGEDTFLKQQDLVEVKTAEQVLRIAEELPKAEVVKLMKYLIDYLVD